MRSSMTILAAASVIGIAAATFADSFSMKDQTIDGGGKVQTASASFNLSGTVGQPDADTPMTGGRFTLTGGFWAAASNEPLPNCGSPGDFDGDGDIDLLDFGQFQICFTGGTGTITPDCQCADFDNDNDADLIDFGAFQLAFTGA